MSWLIKSSVGRKFIMAFSGFCLIFFLLFHMCMNLALVFSLPTYDKICELLGTNWYAIIGSIILAVFFIVHIIYAVALTLKNRKARGNVRYASGNKTSVEWTSKNMFVLGVLIVIFLIWHLISFWYKMQFSELLHLAGAQESGSGLAVFLFSKPVPVILYIIAIIILWFHLSHGFWSMFQSVGWNSRRWFPRVRCIGYIVATVIAVGFVLVPIVLYAKHLCC